LRFGGGVAGTGTRRCGGAACALAGHRLKFKPRSSLYTDSETRDVARTTALPPQPAAKVEPTGPQLDRALASGLAWTGAMKWAGQGVTWISTILVARLLSPEDFGLVAFAAVYMGVVSLLSEFGLGTSVVVLRDLSEEQIARLGGFSVVIGVLCFLVSIPAAYALAAFYRTDALVPVVIVMSISFVLVSFRTIPAALLKRDLRFKALAFMNTARAVIQSGIMVALAFLGFRYWTIVIGGLAGSASYTIMTLAARRHRIALPRRGSMRQALTVSLDVLWSRLAWYLYSSADFVVSGRMLGPTLTGFYSIAWQMASVPVEKVSTLVMQVTPSIMSAVQTDRAALRRYLLNLTEGIALLTLPAAVGMALVTEPFVRVVLTDKYLLAIEPLRYLALYASVRAVTPLFAPVLIALHRTRIVVWNNLLALILLPAAFVIGSRWGTTGIAVAWIVAHPVVVIQIARHVFREIDLKPSTYMAVMWPALVSCGLMAGVVLIVKLFLGAEASMVTRLAAESLAGAATYSAAMFLLFRDRVERFRRFLGTAREKDLA
jgi:PST family polysaccharide transporter